MIISIIVCLAALVILLMILRRDQLSLGIPFAYLALLLIMHLPGAFAHLVAGSTMRGTEYVELGLRYTAIGVACFVFGVWLARLTTHPPRAAAKADRRGFAMYCLV